MNRFLESTSGRGIILNDYISVDDDLMNKISLLLIGKSYKELLRIIERFKLKNDFQKKVKEIIEKYQKNLSMSHKTGKSIMENMKDINNYIVTIDNVPKELKEHIIKYKTNFTLDNPQKELLEKIKEQTVMRRSNQSSNSGELRKQTSKNQSSKNSGISSN